MAQARDGAVVPADGAALRVSLAPLYGTPEESIGGYKPLGYVWNASMKGRRLGFEVSSDHYSAHASSTRS